MSLAAIVEALFEAGATREMIVAAVRAHEVNGVQSSPKSSAAERQKRYRERNKASRERNETVTPENDQGVTENVTTVTKSVTERNAPRARVRDITSNSELTGEDNPSLRSDNSCGGDMFGDGPGTALAVIPLRPVAKQTDAVIAFDGYNAVAAELGLPVARSLTEPRRKALKRRLAEVGLDGWTEALNRLRTSPFCQGKTGNDFIATLDFMLQPKSFTKLVEGAYERRPNGNGTYQDDGSGPTRMAGGAYPRSGGRGPVDIGGIIIRRRAERGE